MLGRDFFYILNGLWFRGAFPRSFLAENSDLSFQWRNNFIKTFLERDIPQLGFTIPAQTLRRFWIMVAHFHGQLWNAAEFGRSLAVLKELHGVILICLWEGFALEQVLEAIKPQEAYFWATYAGAELDLLIFRKDCLSLL